jgi:hypothetical protein
MLDTAIERGITAHFSFRFNSRYHNGSSKLSDVLAIHM